MSKRKKSVSLKLNVGSLVDLALISGLLLLAYYLYARTSLWHTETLPYFLLYDSFIFPTLGLVAAGAWGVRIYRRQLFGEHFHGGINLASANGT